MHLVNIQCDYAPERALHLTGEEEEEWDCDITDAKILKECKIGEISFLAVSLAKYAYVNNNNNVYSTYGNGESGPCGMGAIVRSYSGCLWLKRRQYPDFLPAGMAQFLVLKKTFISHYILLIRIF